ncbi:MAG: hypothetical protein IPM35_06740 [Myxococcales bacterium]|nr:hypothetical protein [Myxococcales bacterium]
MGGIDVTFEIWSALAEPIVGPETVIEGAPGWLSLGAISRADSPGEFALPVWLEGQVEPEVLADLERAAMLYRVRVAPPNRPEHDSHLQAAIQVAATIAEASGGWVLDSLAERVLDAEEMAGSCQPEIANHVSYTLFDTEARTLGMAKLGLPDVTIPSEGVDEAHEHTLVGVLDAVVSGLAAGVFTPDEPFDLAGCEWRFERTPTLLVARPVAMPLPAFVADLSVREDEPPN